MKKIIIILILLLCITGCGKKKAQPLYDLSNQKLIELTEPDYEEPEYSEPSQPDPIITEPVEPITEPEPVITENPSTGTCEKVFSRTYSYVYSTFEECKTQGNYDFVKVRDNIDPTIVSFGCERIVDKCGTEWYGAYFNIRDEVKNELIRKYY